MRLLQISFFCALFTLTSGCASDLLKKAFKGDLAEVENNRIIYDYCQSCHVHRELIPSTHVEEKNELYGKEAFRKTKECRTCHYITKDFWGDVERKTIRPKRKSMKKSKAS